MQTSNWPRLDRFKEHNIDLPVGGARGEMVLRDLMKDLEPKGPCALDAAAVPGEFLKNLVETHAGLKSQKVLSQLVGRTENGSAL